MAGEKSLAEPRLIRVCLPRPQFWIKLAPIICAAVAFAIVFLPLLAGLIYGQMKKLSARKMVTPGSQESLNQSPGQPDLGEASKPATAIEAPVKGAADIDTSAALAPSK